VFDGIRGKGMEASRLLREAAAVAAAVLLAGLLAVDATGLARATALVPREPPARRRSGPRGQGRLRDLQDHGQQGVAHAGRRGMTDVYYPDLGTPSVRDLQFVVSDGKTFAERETDATTRSVQLVDKRALEYRQINTDEAGKYRITKTYVSDPDRATVLVDVTFESLTGEPYQLYALYDP
jgi:glucoamylase